MKDTNSKSFEEVSKEHRQKIEKDFLEDLSKLPESKQSEVLQLSRIADDCLVAVNKDFDIQNGIDNKFRKAGYLPSQATALLNAGKTKDIGKVFKFFGKELEGGNVTYTAFDTFFVKTPFNTVVKADEYIATLQDQLISVADLNSKLTNGSFLDLMKLAFKRLFKKGENRG